jgi:hypothetical protein
VELLIVVGLLAVVASVAIGHYGLQRAYFDQTQARRNAQQLVSEFVNALVAGVDFRVPGDKVATLRRIAAGQRATEGVFAGKHFGLFGISDDALVQAARHVRQDGDGLVFYEFQASP